MVSSPEGAGQPYSTTSRVKTVARVVMAVFSVLVLLLAMELILRIRGYQAPHFIETAVRKTYNMRPQGRFAYVGFLPGNPEDFENPVTLNNLGFHDRDYALPRPTPATFRLLVLGDSYVAALEVKTEEPFHKLLEARFTAEDPLGAGSYQFIALGRGNSAQAGELTWLKTYGPAYEPDMVLLLFFCGNDFMENDPDLYAAANRFAVFYLQQVVPRKLGLFKSLTLLPGSRVNAFLAERIASFYARHLDHFVRGVTAESLIGPDLGAYRTPPTPDWLRAREETGRLLGEMRQASADLGAPFAVAVLSGPQAMGEAGMELTWEGGFVGLDMKQPERWALDWCRENGVPHLNLSPSLEKAGRHLAFWPHDAHLTPFGHKVVADDLYPFLTDLAREKVARMVAPSRPAPRDPQR